MSAPLIGLTTRNLPAPSSEFPMIASPKSYTEALIAASAIPVLVPLNLSSKSNQELLSRIDGIIFTGGGDIEPKRFNGLPNQNIYGVDPERDQSEIELFETVRKMEIPFMGICRGIQVINVALGGSLYTHISDQLPDALEHDCYPTHPTDYLAHPVEIKGGSWLAQILGQTEIRVNSLHHQGIERISSDLIPLAWAPDGLVEACQVPANPFGLAVQWHPEWLSEDRPSQSLFAAFVDSARQHQSGRRAFRTPTQAAA